MGGDDPGMAVWQGWTAAIASQSTMVGRGEEIEIESK